MKISARNVLLGKVMAIVEGSVNNEVTVELTGGHTIVSTITKTSSNNLQLVVGKEVHVIIKASNVMLAVD